MTEAIQEKKRDKVFMTDVAAMHDDIPFVEPERFGKDHYSTLAYVESRCVDHDGALEAAHMRCNARRHRLLASTGLRTSQITRDRGWRDSWGSILKNGEQPYPKHDDWDCVEDLIACGWMEVAEWEPHVPAHPDSQFGSRKIRLALTEEGRRIAAALREHKMDGGGFGTFVPPDK